MKLGQVKFRKSDVEGGGGGGGKTSSVRPNDTALGPGSRKVPS